MTKSHLKKCFPSCVFVYASPDAYRRLSSAHRSIRPMLPILPISWMRKSVGMPSKFHNLPVATKTGFAIFPAPFGPK